MNAAELGIPFSTGLHCGTNALLTLLLLSSTAFAADSRTTTPPAPEAAFRLGPEDVIDVFVWKEPDLSITAVIRPDGKISLPLSNELQASGKTALELQQEIQERLRKYLEAPVVNVMVRQINSLKISVLGEVRRPDVYKIRNTVTVLDALAMAGGFTDLAHRDRVFVLRRTPEGPQRVQVNVKDSVRSDKPHPFLLQALDTVYVE